MPITMNSLENGRIVHIKIVGQWTVADALALTPGLDEHCRMAVYPIHFIIDLTQTNIYPRRLLEIRRSSVFSNPNVHTIAYVGSLKQQIFSETANKLAQATRNRYFATVAEALAYLTEMVQVQSQL